MTEHGNHTAIQEAKAAFEEALQSYVEGQVNAPELMELATVQLEQAGLAREEWIGKAFRLEETGMARTAVDFLRKAEDDTSLRVLALRYHESNPRLALRAWISMTNGHEWTADESEHVYGLIDTLKACAVNREDIARICDGYAAMDDTASLERFQHELFDQGKAHYAKFVRARMPADEEADAVEQEAS